MKNRNQNKRPIPETVSAAAAAQQPDAALPPEALLPSEEETVQRCEELLRTYKAGKQQLEKRIIENERWYRLRHGGAASRSPSDPEPASAWLFNVLANKHADAMDNLPTLTVLPREESDRESAEILCRVLPAILHFTVSPRFL